MCSLATPNRLRKDLDTRTLENPPDGSVRKPNRLWANDSKKDRAIWLRCGEYRDSDVVFLRVHEFHFNARPNFHILRVRFNDIRHDPRPLV